MKLDPDTHLILFDLDGTLVHDYLYDAPCTECKGKGRHKRSPSDEGIECGTCRGRGTELRPDPEYPYETPSLLRGRSLVIESLAATGMRFGICTNQAGAALGHCTTQQTYHRITASLGPIKCFHGACFTVQVCLDHPAATVEPWKERAAHEEGLHRRKPAGGMLVDAMEAMHSTSHYTLFVGDRETDRLAAESVSVNYMDAEDFFGEGA